MKGAACALALAGALLGSTRAGAATTLTTLVQRCAPHVATRTALAVIAVESGGRWWAVNDNDRPTPHFIDPEQALAYARRRVAEGGNIDVGLTQLNSVHLGPMRVSVDEAFEPCTNVAMGMAVLGSDWRSASDRWGSTAYALLKAFEAYNGGSGAWASHNQALRRRVATYAHTVWRQAARLPLDAHQTAERPTSFRAGARPVERGPAGRPPGRGGIHVVFRGSP